MEPINNERVNHFSKQIKDTFNVNWNWLYLRSHLVFAILVFIGMLFFVWWLTT